jgi:hypothetical protein
VPVAADSIDVPVDEPLGAFGNRLIRIIGPVDVSPAMSSDTSCNVEGHHAQRVVGFAGDKIPDDGLEVGFVEGRLDIG